jgi:sugar diacid utilization regulator
MTLSIVLSWLGGAVVWKHVPSSFGGKYAGCEIWEQGADVREDCLYLVDADTAMKAIASLPQGKQITLLMAVDGMPGARFLVEDSVALAAVSLSMTALCNRVFEMLRGHARWVAAMNCAIYEASDIDSLLLTGAERLRAHVFLLNAGYKVTAFSRKAEFPNAVSDELMQNGYLSHKSIIRLGAGRAEADSDTDTEGAPFSFSADSLLFYPIKYKSNVVARLLVVFPSADCRDDMLAPCSLFCEYVALFMLRHNEESYRTNNEFGVLLSDLIESRLWAADELRERLMQMTIHIKKYYHCVVVELEPQDHSPPYGQMINELERIFPYSNIAVYKGDIVILARRTHHYASLQYDAEKLSALLASRNGYASIGNYSKYLTSLRPIYLQTKQIIKYAKALRNSERERIFAYEDYSMYHLIGLLSESCFDFHHDNLIYLCHPGIISLEKYDRRYHTDYREILRVYLINDRNASKTAKDLYLHRNTMINRIEKIEEIVGESLNNGVLQQRLLFSHMVLEFVTRYKKEDLLALKKN